MNITIKLNELTKLVSCERAYQFKKLSLNTEDRRYNFLYASLEEMKRLLSSNAPSSLLEDYMCKTYSMDWFENMIAYEKAKEKDFALLLRLMNYIISTQSKIIEVNKYYSVAVDDCCINNISFNTINDKVDLILKRENEYEAIKFSLKEPSYSYKARKPSNIVTNSVELLTMHLGLCKQYPDLNVSLYHLKNKNDTADDFKPYENKKGNNIITMKFHSIDNSTLMSAISLPRTIDCDNCYYKSLCSYNGCIRTVSNREIEQKEQQKAITYTEKQLQVINHVTGPINVIAVPGAGKTKSLVARLINLMEHHNVKPLNILFLTFTNKACEEIKERVSKSIKNPEQLPHIYTFNGLGYNILRENKALIGNIRLADTTDRLCIIRDVLDMVPPIQGVSYEAMYAPYGIIKRCDKWFQLIDQVGKDAFNDPKLDTKGILRAYDMFSAKFKAMGFISFDEQVLLCNQLFKSHPNVLKLYSRQYRYIMVDEYQDVDIKQVQFIYSLASHYRNIVVVGDDDQGIYKFRGGSNKFLFEFSKVFPQSKTVIMNDNFRSNDKILTTSSVLIKSNNNRFAKEFIPHNEGKTYPLLIPYNDTDTIVKYIKQANKKFQLGDIAIISRNNSTLNKISGHLAQYYKCSSPKDYLIDDNLFLLLFDLLQVFYKGLTKDESFYRLAILGKVDTFLAKTDKSISLYESFVTANLLPSIDVSKLLSEFQTNGEGPLMVFASKLFQSLKLIQYSRCITDTLLSLAQLWADVSIEHPILKNITKIIKDKSILSLKSLYTYFCDLIKYEDKTRVSYDIDPDCINLLTAHDSKGKEYPCVILIIDDFNETFSSCDDLEEERRLLFVGMTRAKDNLAILQSKPHVLLEGMEEYLTKIS